jgi:hypothetical protein
MHKRLPAAVIIGIVALCSGLNAAQAADQTYCRGYASAALNQVRGALSNPACVGGAQGARWSRDYKVHYDWCLARSYAATGEERDARTNYLRGCRP